jgi:tetratricopeptide (TPR) repeat protein
MSALTSLAQSLLALYRQSSLASASKAERRAELQRLASLALALGNALHGDLRRFAELSERLGDSQLAECLLDLPSRLGNVNETKTALAVARAFEFIAPDKMRGDSAVALAQAGQRADAIALIADNLARAEDAALAEAKAGDAYRALGEADSAEVYYRRSLSESKSPFERSEAVLRIVSLLSDSGREQDAARFLAEERERAQKA